MVPHSFRLLLIPPRNSSTVHYAPWDFIRCPQFLLTHQLLHWHPTRINQRMTIWRTEWPRMRNLTTNSTTSTEVLGDTSTELRRKAFVLQASFVWPDRVVRPPKEVVAGPVRNAGIVWCSTSLTMNIIIRWSQARSHFAAAEKRCCKMLEMGWREFLGGRTRMLRQVVSHLTLRLPHHKRVCFTSRCCSNDQRRTYTWPA